nr:penicillin-binding transpeptidase domain-containing protein [Streptomyces scabichelini]
MSLYRWLVADSGLRGLAEVEEGLYESIDEPTRSPDPYTVPGSATTLENAKASVSCEDVSMRTAFRHSCDTVFARMAVDLGQSQLKKTAEKFGFNADKFTPLRVGRSEFPGDMSEGQAALAGIGQFKVTDAAGKVLKSYDDSATTRVVSEGTAAELREAMAEVVTVTVEGVGGTVSTAGIARRLMEAAVSGSGQ